MSGDIKSGLRQMCSLAQAMGDLFAEAYPADKVCTLKCGRCQTPADAACACPAQVKSDCSADVDKMSVRLDSIYVKAEAAAFGGELLVDIQIRLAGPGARMVDTGADATRLLTKTGVSPNIPIIHIGYIMEIQGPLLYPH